MELQRPGVLHLIDDGMGVAAKAEPGAGRGKFAGRADAIAEIAFGCRAHADRALACTEPFDVVGGEMRGVHCGEVGVQHAVFVEQLRRGAAERGATLFVLGPLLGEVGVNRRRVASRPFGDRRHCGGIDRTHRMDGGAHQLSVVHLELVHPAQPALDRSVAEAPLDTLGGTMAIGIEARMEVEGVEQGDADTGLVGCGQQRSAHCVRIVV